MVGSSIIEIVLIFCKMCFCLSEGIALTKEEKYLVYCGQQMAACML